MLSLDSFGVSWTSILKGEHVGESTISPCCGDIDDLNIHFLAAGGYFFPYEELPK